MLVFQTAESLKENTGLGVWVLTGLVLCPPPPQLWPIPFSLLGALGFLICEMGLMIFILPTS